VLKLSIDVRIRKILFVVACLFIYGQAQAATYYASTTGSAVSCASAQTIGTPRASVNTGVQCLASGDQLYLCAGACDGAGTGTFAESLINPSLASGTASAYTKVTAYPGETIWLKPAAGPPAVIGLSGNYSYIEFDGIRLDMTNSTTTNRIYTGLSVDWSSATVYAHHIRYKNGEILQPTLGGDLSNSAYGINVRPPTPVGVSGVGGNEFLTSSIHGGGGTNGNYGIYSHGSHDIYDGLDIYGTGVAGIQIYSSDIVPQDNIIRNNKIHDITQGFTLQRVGIQAMGSNHLVYNNLLYGITAGSYTGSQTAINFFASGSGNKAWNNTIADNQAAAFGMDAGVSGTEIKNNIAYGNSIDGIDPAYSGSGTTTGTNLFGSNPIFSNPAADNYHLTAASTNAIDRGTVWPTQLTALGAAKDLEGTARPFGNGYDIGVYEFNSGSEPPPPDPCVTDPLLFTVNRWPLLSTGSRRLDYSVNKTANITLTMRATPWRATAIDTRGCSVTVTKP
jgi:hypothetical protein